MAKLKKYLKYKLLSLCCFSTNLEITFEVLQCKNVIVIDCQHEQ